MQTGMTAMRLGGLVYGAFLAIMFAAFTAWAIWPPAPHR